MSVSDKDIIEACMPILQSVRTHNSGERCFLTAYQIWTLLVEQNSPICERLERYYGSAVGEGGGAHVGPAQRIAQALGRAENIETHFLDTRKILFRLQKQTYRASGPDCGLFQLRSDGNKKPKSKLDSAQCAAVENMHKTFLEALRHREQEILRFLAILAPSLGGFIWLLTLDFSKGENSFVFTIGTLGVLLFLLLGAVYSLALGYNFRYVTLQLAKMESDFCLNIKEFILESWLRTANKWVDEYKKKRCSPPEIIKVFWLSFIIAKIFVLLTAVIFLIINQKYVGTTIAYISYWNGLCHCCIVVCAVSLWKEAV